MKRMPVKAARILAAVAVCMCAATGCGKETPRQENEPYQSGDISEGLYIMSDSGDFYSPNRSGENFTGEAAAAGDERRIISSLNDTKYIPTLYRNDRLVYFTHDKIPDSFGIEKFRDAGYTFGLYGLSRSSGGEYVFGEECLIQDSSLYNTFNGYLNGNTAVLVSVDGNPPEYDDISLAGTFRCKKKGEKKTIAFLKGTYYSEVETTADEHVWYSSETSSVISYQVTKNGFIILELPDTIKDGDYLSVAGTGLIHVSDRDRPEEREEN